MRRTLVTSALFLLLGASSAFAEEPAMHPVVRVVDAALGRSGDTDHRNRVYLTIQPPSLRTRGPAHPRDLLKDIPDRFQFNPVEDGNFLMNSDQHSGLVHSMEVSSPGASLSLTRLGQKVPFASPLPAPRVEVAANLPVGSQIHVQTAHEHAAAQRAYRANPGAADAASPPVIEVTRQDPNVPNGIALLHATTARDSRWPNGLHLRTFQQRSAMMVSRPKSSR